MARSMFAHAEILMGKKNHRGQTCAYRIFRKPKSASILTCAGGRLIVSPRLRTPVRRAAFRLPARERHEACLLQIRSRRLRRSRALAQGGTWRRREIPGRRPKPDAGDEFPPGSAGG